MRTLMHYVAGDRCPVYVPEFDEDIVKFEQWLSVNGHEILALDTEATGLDIYAAHHRLRLVQVGTGNEVWVLRADKFADVIRSMLLRPFNFVAHNAQYDMLVFDRHLGVKLEQLMPKVHDTKIHAHLLDPRGRDEGGIGLMLKNLSEKYVDQNAKDFQTELYAAFHHFGWTKKTGWGRIPIEHVVYLLYASMDVLLTARLFKYLRQQTSGMDGLCRFEHRLQYLLTILRRKGMRIDVPYTERFTTELHNEWVEFCDRALELGVDSVNSTAQVIARLQEMGETLTEVTGTGNLKVDRAVLLPLADLDDRWKRIGAREPNPLADAVIRAKRALKWKETYAEAMLLQRDPYDRIHPTINSLQARTARMCLPETERLLTRRGLLVADSIVVGDETLDAAGNWVKITAVHRYAQQETVEYRVPGARYALRSTREHRWLQRSTRGVVSLKPAGASQRTVLLTPEPSIDPFETMFLGDTAGERFASLIGLLATDGRLHVPAETQVGVGMMAVMYQTERKFYKEILELIPEGWLSYDRITDGGDHHEVGLRIRQLRPHLEAFDLVPAPGGTLKDHPGLVSWVGSIPLREVAAFFRAAYMADGAVSSGHRIITVKSPNLIEALRLAGYRLGWLANLQTMAPSSWSAGPRTQLSFRRGVLCTSGKTALTTYTADVWCVSTETGTFTAEGELGLYLTGNSISDVPLQQLPSGDWRVRRSIIPDEGMLMIAADYQAVEMRVLAALSSDFTMKAAIREGKDLHTFTAAKVAGMAMEEFKRLLDSGDPDASRRRKIAKSIGFGKVYGGGAATVSRQTGADIEGVRAAMKAYDETYPGIRRYAQELARKAEGGLREVVTPIGRRLPLDEDRIYAATNYMVQSTARDLLAKAVVHCFEAGLGDYLLLPVHDELLGQAPAENAEEVITEIGKVMESTFKGVFIESSPKVLGTSWGAGYKAPEVLPLEPLARKERKVGTGQWVQEGLDIAALC